MGHFTAKWTTHLQKIVLYLININTRQIIYPSIIILQEIINLIKLYSNKLFT